MCQGIELKINIGNLELRNSIKKMDAFHWI